MLYSASFDRLRPKSTRKRRRSNGGGGGGGGAGEGGGAAVEPAAAAWEPFLKNSRQQPFPSSSSASSSSSSSSQTSSGNVGSAVAMKGFKKEYCRLKTLVPALSEREDLSKASADKGHSLTTDERALYKSKARFA